MKIMEQLVIFISLGLLYGTGTAPVKLVASKPIVVENEPLTLTCTYQGNGTIHFFKWNINGKDVIVLTSCETVGLSEALEHFEYYNTSFSCSGLNTNLFRIEKVPRSLNGTVVSCLADYENKSNTVTLVVQGFNETTNADYISSYTTPRYIASSDIDSTSTVKDTVRTISKATTSEYSKDKLTQSSLTQISTTTGYEGALRTNANGDNDQTASTKGDTLDSGNTTTSTTRSTILNDETTSTNGYTSATFKVITSTAYTTRSSNETTGTNDYIPASKFTTLPTTYHSRFSGVTTSTNDNPDASECTAASNAYTSRSNYELTGTNNYVSESEFTTKPTTYHSRFSGETTKTNDYTYAPESTVTPTTHTSRSNYASTGTNDYVTESEFITKPTTYHSRFSGETTKTNDYTYASESTVTPTTHTSRSNYASTGTNDYVTESEFITKPTTYHSRFSGETTKTNDYTYAPESTVTPTTHTSRSNYASTGTNDYVTESEFITKPTTYHSRFSGETTKTNDYTYAPESTVTPTTHTSRSNYASTGTNDYVTESEFITKPTTYHSRFSGETTKTNDYTYAPESTVTPTTHTSRSNYASTGTNNYISESEFTTKPTTYHSRFSGETTKTNDYTYGPESTVTPTTHTSRSNYASTSTNDYVSGSAFTTKPTTYHSRFSGETTKTNDYTYGPESTVTPTIYTSRSNYEAPGTNGYKPSSEHTTLPTYPGEMTSTNDYTYAPENTATPATHTSRSNYETAGTTDNIFTPGYTTTPSTKLSTFSSEMTNTYDYTYAPESTTTPTTYTYRSDYEMTGTNNNVSASEFTTTPTTYTSRSNSETTSINNYSYRLSSKSPLFSTGLNYETKGTKDYIPDSYTSATTTFGSISDDITTNFNALSNDERTSSKDNTHVPKRTVTSTTYATRSNEEIERTKDYISISDNTTTSTTSAIGSNNITSSTSEIVNASESTSTSAVNITTSNAELATINPLITNITKSVNDMTSINYYTYTSMNTTTTRTYASGSNNEASSTADYKYASESSSTQIVDATKPDEETTNSNALITNKIQSNDETSRTKDYTYASGSNDYKYSPETNVTQTTIDPTLENETFSTKDNKYASETSATSTAYASSSNDQTSTFYTLDTTKSQDEPSTTENYIRTSERSIAQTTYATRSDYETANFNASSTGAKGLTSTRTYTSLSAKTITSNNYSIKPKNETSSTKDYTKYESESTAASTKYVAGLDNITAGTKDYTYYTTASIYATRPTDKMASASKAYPSASEISSSSTKFAITSNDRTTETEVHTSSSKYKTTSKAHATESDDEVIAIKDNTSVSAYMTASTIFVTSSPNRETSAPTVIVEDTGEHHSHCTRDIDSRRTQWNVTKAGSVVSIPCFQRNPELSGNIFRKCTSAGTWMMPKYDCVRKDIKDIQNMVSSIKDSISNTVIDNVLGNLSTLTSQRTQNEDGVYSGEIEVIAATLEDIANLENLTVTDSQAMAFLKTASNLLDSDNTEAWQAIDQNSSQNKDVSAAAKLLDTISVFVDVIAQSLDESQTNKTIAVSNLLLHVRKINDSAEIVFPEGGEYKEFARGSTLNLSRDSLTGSTLFSAVLYRNLSGIMSTTATFSSNAVLGSAVTSAKLNNWKSNNNFKIRIAFEHKQVNNLSAVCSFRKEKSSLWEKDGCFLKSWNITTALCECNHLTNFAILMSPWTKENIDSTAINVVSIVGCSVSTLCLLLTMITHLIFWRYLKSDRVKILMNLCFALVISYVIFLSGVDRTENENGCTAVAALLHYIYLVVFFLMLAEGIEIFFALIYVFASKSRLKWILPAAWLLPAVIVGVSLAATKRKGYGNNQFCWLSFDNGLIWAFVGPALCIILINSVLLGFVMRAVFRSKKVLHKDKKEKVLTGFRCLCVLLPLVGCTWVIGIFYVNKSMSWIQYIFAVCNGFQGLVIFIFQCALNKQIPKAYKAATTRRKSGTLSLSVATPTPTSKLRIIPKSIARYLSSAQYSVGWSNKTKVSEQGIYSSIHLQDDDIDNNCLFNTTRLQFSEYFSEEGFCTHL